MVTMTRGRGEASWRLSRARRGESNIISCDQSRAAQQRGKGGRDQNHEGARGEERQQSVACSLPPPLLLDGDSDSVACTG